MTEPITNTEHAQLLRELATDNEMLLEVIWRHDLVSLFTGRQLIGAANRQAHQVAEEIEGREVGPNLGEVVKR